MTNEFRRLFGSGPWEPGHEQLGVQARISTFYDVDLQYNITIKVA